MTALGVMGGTFNPVHSGHLHAAIAVAKAFSLPQVKLMPCDQPVHKDLPDVSGAQRLAMLQLAVAKYDKLSVDDRELTRLGASYTIDSLKAIRAEIGTESKLYFALGTDAFASLKKWRHWQQMFDYANFIVLHRPGAPWFVGDDFLQRRLMSRESQHPCAGALFELSVEALDVSSTQIRQAMKQQLSVSGLVPDVIERYLKQHHLYQ